MKITGIKPGAKWVLLLLLGVGAFFAVKKFYLDAPKSVGESQKVDKITLADAPEASLKGAASVKLAIPSDKAAMRDVPKIDWKIMAWNSQFPLMYANGGPRTTQGSLMDKANVDINIIRQDDCFKSVADFIKNAQDYKANPQGTTPLFVSFMGDGMPGFSVMMKDMEKNLGPDYVPIIVYHMGRSNGEDQFMGPSSWKANPQAALGGTFTAVELDGDANIVFNWASNNGIPLNVNTKVYDPKALNLIPANDFLEAGNKYITGYTEKRSIVMNGKTTGRDTTIGVMATTTWTPGDVNVALQKGGLVRIASTHEYSSQMPNATFVLKKWAYDHRTACRDAVALLGSVLGGAAAALAPSRLALRTFEVETRVRFAIDRTKRVEVKVSPLNLGYDLRYESSATQESRIRIQVAQAPPRAEATITTEEGGRRGGPTR